MGTGSTLGIPNEGPSPGGTAYAPRDERGVKYFGQISKPLNSQTAGAGDSFRGFHAPSSMGVLLAFARWGCRYRVKLSSSRPNTAHARKR